MSESAREEEILELIKKHLKKVMGRDFDLSKVTMESTYEGLGLDSLSILEITMLVESELDAYVPASEIANAKTIGDLIRTYGHAPQ